MDLNLQTRYQNQPLILFFEKYVLYTIGVLPAEKSAIIDSLELNKVFSTKATSWPRVIEEVLQLSTTLRIAILNEWIDVLVAKTQELTETDEIEFARMFTDRYFAADSQIDRWSEPDLANAKNRVSDYFGADALA